MDNAVYLNRGIAVRDRREFHADDAHELNRLVTKFSREFSPTFVQDWNRAYTNYCGMGQDIILIHHNKQ